MSVSFFASVKTSKLGDRCRIKRWARVSASTLGEQCVIGRNVVVDSSICEGYNNLASRVQLKRASLGIHSYIARDTSLRDLSVGRFCSIGSNVRNRPGNHPTRGFVSTHPAFYSPNAPTGAFVEKQYYNEFGENVRIGHDVWIGTDSLLMDGVTVGDGAIVAARSVVTKNVPPYAIVGGTPAKLIRYRFDELTIQSMLKLRWWDRGLDWINQNASLFRNPESFLAASADGFDGTFVN